MLTKGYLFTDTEGNGVLSGYMCLINSSHGKGCINLLTSTKFYWAQFECDELAGMVPDGDTVWDGTFDAQKDWAKMDRLLKR